MCYNVRRSRATEDDGKKEKDEMDSREQDFAPTGMWVDGNTHVTWDRMTLVLDGYRYFYEAWGDGAHCKQVGYTNCNGCLEPVSNALHVGELDRALDRADAVYCELKGVSTYRRERKAA